MIQPVTASALTLALFGGAEASASWGSLTDWASPQYSFDTPSTFSFDTPTSFNTPIATENTFEAYSPGSSFGATTFGSYTPDTTIFNLPTETSYSASMTTASSPSLLTTAYTPATVTYASTLESSSAYEYSPSSSFMYTGSFDLPKDNGKTADDVFDQTKVRRYNIDISQSDITKLNSDISAEEFVPCTITTDYGDADSTTYTGVGCRYKGAIGSLLKCLDPNTGRPNGDCRKFSIKVDGNKYRNDDQKIDGVKQLLLHGMAVDQSLVSERLSYNAMQDVGILGPRAAHGQVYINGKFDGVYTVVEAPGNTISKRGYKEDANKGKGAWYKDIWFNPDQMSDYALEEYLSSGDEEHAFMKEVYQMLQTAQDCATFEQYFDIESIAKITALNDYLGQTDDWRYRHNFQWYVNEDIYGNKKLVMIPWDYDRLDDKSGGLPVRRQRVGSWMNAKPSGSTCYQSDPPSQKGYGFARTYAKRMDAGMPPGLQKPIECDKLTRFISQCGYDKVKAYEAQYSAQLPYSTLSSRIDQYAREISSSVEQDTSITNSEWAAGRQSLKTFLRTAPQYSPTKGSSTSFSTGMGGFGGMPAMGGFGGMTSLGGMGGFGGFGGMTSMGGLGGFGGMTSMGGLGGFGGMPSIGGFGGMSSFGFGR